MINRHQRRVAAPIEALRPLVEACWSGGAADPFPRDVLPSWRRNPPGADPAALLPNVTLLGHGGFAFRFESWDGFRWRVRVESGGYHGWHGFELRPAGDGVELIHTIELRLSGGARLTWPLMVAPIHDWCVEAIFDRIETALVAGAVPARSVRPMPWRVRATLALLRRVGPRRRRTPAPAGA